MGVRIYRAKLGLPYAEPLTFLFLRMFGAVLLLGVIALHARPKWPDRNGVLDSCAIGVFIHALYLGGVYISIRNGLPAALSALIVGLQPLLTSTTANRLLRERVVALQWGGPALSGRSGQGDDGWDCAARVGSVHRGPAQRHLIRF
jgi:drug/metabolite transporter (DMT)-like permease